MSDPLTIFYITDNCNTISVTSCKRSTREDAWNVRQLFRHYYYAWSQNKFLLNGPLGTNPSSAKASSIDEEKLTRNSHIIGKWKIILYTHLLPHPRFRVPEQSTSCNGGSDGIDLEGLFSVPRDLIAVISRDEDASMSTLVDCSL
jgi:hypothetical protein